MLVIGLPRYGKTTFIRTKLTATAPRVYWHDVTGHDYTGPGRRVCDIDTLELHPEWWTETVIRIVIVCKSPGDPEVIKDEVLRLIRVVAQTRNCVVVFDEAQAHARRTEHALNGLFARGNHFGIVPIICAQRATDIPLGCRVNASDVYCFGQHNHGELKALRDDYGDLYALACQRQRKSSRVPVHWNAEEREKWWTELPLVKRGNSAAKGA